MSEATGIPVKLEGGDFPNEPCAYCGRTPSAARLEFRVPNEAGGGRLVHHSFCTVHVSLARAYTDRVQAALERGEVPPDPRVR